MRVFMKKYLLSIAIMLLVVFVYSCKDEDDDQHLDDSVIFTGKIIDNQDIAIPFAEVEFYEEVPTSGKSQTKLLSDKFITSDTTDEEGNFSVTIPDNENIYMMILHQDFQNKKYKIKEIKNKDGLTLLKGDKEVECTATLNVVLTDEDGKAVSDAYIKLTRDDKLIKKAKTNDNGKFTFEEVCPGDYNIAAFKNDNSVSESNYKIVSDETYDLSLKMQQQDKDSCCEGSIQFNLKDKESGDKANGTVILKQDGKEKRSKKTDGGSTKFEELCEGEYTVVIENETHERMEFTYEVDCNEEYEITKELTKKDEKDSCCEGKFELFPIGKDGKVINGAKVFIYKDGKVIQDPVVKDGKAVQEDLCEGKYTIVIKAEGYEDLEYTIELGCNKTVESEKEMTVKEDDCCDASLSMVLKDKESGDKVNGTVILKQDGKEKRSKKTDGGSTKFEELCEGKYTVIIETENHERMEFAYEIDCDKEYELTKELTKKDEKDSCCEGKIEFYPIGKDGKVINGAKVFIYKDGKVIQDPVVKDGKAVQEDLCEGKYTIVIKAEGYEDLEYTIELGCNKTVESEKEMTAKEDDCCDGSLSIVLKDKESGDKVNGTVILKQDGKEKRSKKTDGGFAKLEELCEGKYTVIIETETHERMEFAYEIDCDKAQELTKELSKKDNKDSCCEGIMKFYPIGKDGKVINGAKVYIYKDGKVIEDPVVKDGKAVADGLCEGKYTIVIKAEGYEDLEYTIELGCNKTVESEKEMTAKEEDCCDASFQVLLKDKDSGKTINGTVILKKEGKENRSKKTDGGYAKFEELCEGKYTIVIETEDHERMEFTYEIDCDKEIEITKELTAKDDDCCEGSLWLQTKDKDGNKVKSTIVLRRDGKEVKTKTSDNGYFVIGELCKGKYSVLIEAEGFEKMEFTYEQGCNDTVEVGKILTKKEDCCEAIIKSIVKDNDNKAVEGATVEYWLDGKIVKEGKTNADGVFIGKDLCLGEYTIVIKKDGYNTIEENWNIEKCDDFQETFKLKK